MADVMDQSFQDIATNISIRVNGEIFESILSIPTVSIKSVVCVGHITSMNGDNITIQLDSAEFSQYKKGSNVKLQNYSANNYYQFSINVADKVIEYIHDFGENFDIYSYQTSFFNYWFILKDRYPQLKGEAMDQN